LGKPPGILRQFLCSEKGNLTGLNTPLAAKGIWYFFSATKNIQAAQQQEKTMQR
jgi:hypothetical protein